MKTLTSIDHVIRIVFTPMHIDPRLKWEAPHSEMKSKYFGIIKEKVFVPGRYTYGSWPIESLSEFDVNLYVIKKTDHLDEGPQGSIFYKPCVAIESAGGKYTIKQQQYFGTDAEAEAYLDEIESRYPDKFIIIKQ